MGGGRTDLSGCLSFGVAIDGVHRGNTDNAQLVENPNRINCHDRYEEAIFRAKEIMQDRGWKTEITYTQERCHKHLYVSITG